VVVEEEGGDMHLLRRRGRGVISRIGIEMGNLRGGDGHCDMSAADALWCAFLS